MGLTSAMTAGLAALDLAVVIAYLGAVLGLSWYLALRQRTGTDYFLAGRAMGGGLLAVSILANQLSAVSLIGAPAFVALRPGGGLSWLQYELAVPLAMLAAIVLLVPMLRSLPGTSIYEFAEQRYGPGTRRALAGAFLLSRGLALGVLLYASALVVSGALGWPVEASILAIGLFSLCYTSLGGIVADIWSDAIQLVVLLLGLLAGVIAVLLRHGSEVIAAIPVDRTQALVAGAGLGEGGTFAFWPMLLGGFFLYVSYYACDQSQAQRLLAARSEAEARKALMLNGVLRFPLVLTYCLFGLLLGGLLATDAAFSTAMAGRPADGLVPLFMMEYVPAGLRGLMFAGLLAAAMSSIDSAMNSLAAVTLEDVLRRDPASLPARWGRLTSALWGLFAVGSGLAFAESGTGVLELVNLIGSAFYGPILAVFILGVVTRGVTGRGAVAGLLAGLAGNLLLSRLAPQLSWLWWNVTGFVVAGLVATVVSARPLDIRRPGWPVREGRILLAAFAAILALLVVMPAVVRAVAGH